jgi:hypothetical protein
MRKEMRTKYDYENLKGRDYLEDTVTHRRKLLNWIIEKQGEGVDWILLAE